MCNVGCGRVPGKINTGVLLLEKPRGCSGYGAAGGAFCF